jgi:uracil-DNA glycosylase
MHRFFDVGYANDPFRTLCEEYPDDSVYTSKRFRTEWGPIFHRGRLDGSARVLVIGQDPAQNENIVRRILVGEAGRRIQGFLAKLGIERSYVLVNTYLYSVYGSAGSKYVLDPAIAGYRNRWLDALLVNTQVEAVVALGVLAEAAWNGWKATGPGLSVNVPFVKIIHPTQPQSASKGDKQKLSDLTRKLLENWNQALQTLKPAVVHPDVANQLTLYGTAFLDAERPPIPDFDLPAGLPIWMGEEDGWARRVGKDDKAKRATITITVPKAYRP